MKQGFVIAGGSFVPIIWASLCVFSLLDPLLVRVGWCGKGKAYKKEETRDRGEGISRGGSKKTKTREEVKNNLRGRGRENRKKTGALYIVSRNGEFYVPNANPSKTKQDKTSPLSLSPTSRAGPAGSPLPALWFRRVHS